MKKIIHCVCLVLSISAFAQNGWQLLNPTPSWKNGLDIHFSSNETGYIITENELLETVDSGESWHVKQPLISATDIHFNDDIGVIVGLSGYAMKSIDGGVTWTEMNTGTSEAFNSVTVLDANNIILSSSAKLVKTSNGGDTWQILSIPGAEVNPALVKKTVFVTPLIGHAVCNGKQILKTTDGGLTWYITLAGGNTTNFITLCFADENVGFASTDFNELMKTSDGGENWVTLQNISMEIRSIFFLDVNRGYIAGELGRVHKTVDGGASWQVIDPPNSYFGGMDLNGIFFTSEDIGFSAGLRGRILKTINGGELWKAYSPSYLDVRSIDFVNNTRGFALMNNKVYRTSDAGVTWTYRGEITSEFVIPKKIKFVSASTGYLLASGVVFKTINAGTTWEVVNGGAGMNIAEIDYIDFIDENTGYVSGHNFAKLYKTIDGGLTWQLVSTEINNCIQFLNANIGYSLRNGIVYKTIDGGSTWNETNDSNSPYGESIDFLNENDGYALTSNFIKRTIDGGQSWNVYSLPGLVGFDFLEFTDENTGFIANEAGSVFKTVDGGESWQPIGNNHDITTMTNNNGYLYIGGIWGRISRFQNEVLSDQDFNIGNSSVYIYPNPTSGDLNVVSKESTINKIEIFDLLGKRVTAGNVEANQIGVIDVSNLKNGVYILKIYLKDKVQIKKFIKS